MWEDSIREWRDLEFVKSQRAVENRGKWRKLVAKSSVVPQRSSRLRLIVMIRYDDEENENLNNMGGFLFMGCWVFYVLGI